MDRQGRRFLYSYRIDGKKPIVDKSTKFEVPDEWSGDPETVFVTLESIQDSASQNPDAVNLPAGLEELIENGDRVLVTDYENSIIGEIVKIGNVIVMRRKEGFGLS